MRKQGQMCKEGFERRRKIMLEDLPVELAQVLIENGSQLGRKWLNAIPFNPAVTLTDHEVSAALHFRTLCAEPGVLCARCGDENGVGHDTVCSARENWRLARHEVVKKIMARNLDTVRGTKLDLEPFVRGCGSRTDFRITGMASVKALSSEYDLNFTSLHSAPSRKATKDELRRDNGRTREAALKDAIEAALSFTSKEKIRLYQDKITIPFIPVVISTGGMLHRAALMCLEHWKTKMPSFALMMMSISLAIIRARAKGFMSQ